MPNPFSKLISNAARPPARAQDGLTDEEASQAERPTFSFSSLLHDLSRLRPQSARYLTELLTTALSRAPVDDRKLVFEHSIALLQSLPVHSALSGTLSDQLVVGLWRGLPHPPAMYVGPTDRYRSADGSGNHPLMRDLGRAGTPYSRSVAPVQPRSAAAMPDPALVFEQLLRRPSGESFKVHPSRLNRLFFSFATVVIHELFQSNRQDPWINETSSYVDLSTLYGNNAAQQATVRTYENGRIWADVVASDRIMLMPPAVVAIVVIFSRHHNYIAKRLLEVNEAGKYSSDWTALSDEQKRWQDEDIFQLSRNINVAFFATVVLKDYVASILNTVRADSNWSLDIGKEIANLDGTRVERGTGNSISVEFSAVYTWHSALSSADDLWVEDRLKEAFPDKSIDEIGVKEWATLEKRDEERLASSEPKHWTFGDLERGADGHFDDVQLAEIIKDAIEEPAHAFGARSVPASLKIIEVLRQLQARNVFQVCTMQEFRKYLNLKPFDSFLAWNSDPAIAKAAEQLYGHIDNLELYPGLLAEEAKPSMPGSGLCPGQTIGRGILNDAVSLIRSDRFLSYDMNISTLTSWGMSQLRPQGGAYGGVLPTLLFRALPAGWKFNSVYGLLPFYTPASARKILTDHGRLELYDEQRPASDATMRTIHSYEACRAALLDRDTFLSVGGHSISSNGHSIVLTFATAQQDDAQAKLIAGPFFTKDFDEGVKTVFAAHTRAQVETSRMPIKNGQHYQLDVVRDIANVVPILWLGQKFSIPLKTAHEPAGLISPAQLLSALTTLFTCTSSPLRTESEWDLREGARSAAATLSALFEARLKAQRQGGLGVLGKVTDWLARGSSHEVSSDAAHLLDGLLASKRPNVELVAAMMALIVPIAGILTKATSLVVDLFLQEKYQTDKQRLIELAQSDDDDTAALHEIEGYVLEAMRVQPIQPGVPRQAARDLTIRDSDENDMVSFKAGERLVLGTSQAQMDPSVFPEPEKLDPHRPREIYLSFLHPDRPTAELCSSSSATSFGTRLLVPAIASMLKELFKLPGLRRAGSGLVRIRQEVAEGLEGDFYLDLFSRETNSPTSLRVEYDAVTAAA
ncbi:hypothetical protein OC844_000029 [Tilletia horrida]|nr:hypothetical protein OC844_000029 [Tilletia horrida]